MLNKDLVEKVGPFKCQNSAPKIWKNELAENFRNVVQIGHDDANFGEIGLCSTMLNKVLN